MPLKGSKQTQEVVTCLDTSTPSRQFITSMSQPTYQFIEGPFMDLTVDDSLYARIQTLELKCENILEAELASLPDT